MKINKILCKYLDEENKGYVNGWDFIQAFILYGLLFIVSLSYCAFTGEILLDELRYDGYVEESILKSYTIENIFVGFVITTITLGIVLTIIKMLMAFAKHKFVTCERGDSK